jgi:ribonuclease BN (tRNA processing enzyme)
MLDLARDGDVLICDSMFTPEQYLGLWDDLSRESWGHSTWEGAVELALAANVKKLVLFHHGNDDDMVGEIEEKARERFPETMAAYEGLEIEL